MAKSRKESMESHREKKMPHKKMMKEEGMKGPKKEMKKPKGKKDCY